MEHTYNNTEIEYDIEADDIFNDEEGLCFGCERANILRVIKYWNQVEILLTSIDEDWKNEAAIESAIQLIESNGFQFEYNHCHFMLDFFKGLENFFIRYFNLPTIDFNLQNRQGVFHQISLVSLDTQSRSLVVTMDATTDISTKKVLLANLRERILNEKLNEFTNETITSNIVRFLKGSLNGKVNEEALSKCVMAPNITMALRRIIEKNPNSLVQIFFRIAKVIIGLENYILDKSINHTKDNLSECFYTLTEG